MSLFVWTFQVLKVWSCIMENIEKLDKFLENVDKISEYLCACYTKFFIFLIMFNNGM